MAALLPPSSSRLRPKRAATRGPTSRPIRVEPVARDQGDRGDRRPAPRRRRGRRAPAGGQSAGRADVLGGLGEEPVGRPARISGVRSGRLPDHGVAADQGDGGVPGPDGHGEVERGDDADDAERVPGFGQPVAGAFGGDGASVELAGQADREVADVDHLLDLAERLGADLARLDGDQIGQVAPCGRAAARPARRTSSPRRAARAVAPGEEGRGGRRWHRVGVGRVSPAARSKRLSPVIGVRAVQAAARRRRSRRRAPGRSRARPRRSSVVGQGGAGHGCSLEGVGRGLASAGLVSRARRRVGSARAAGDGVRSAAARRGRRGRGRRGRWRRTASALS